LAARTGSYDFDGLYLSTDGGETFSKKSATPNILGWFNGTAAQADIGSGQGWFDLSLAVSPTDINTIFAGGINVWRSTNSGTSWSKISAWDANTNSSNYVHADVHDLVFSGNTLYAGSDGGVHVSTNNGSSWSNISENLAIAQIYNIGLSADNENMIFHGQQDNGSNLTTNGRNWTQVNGGDGMYSFIDYSNDRNLFTSIYNGNFYRSTNGGSTFSKIYTVSGGGWVTPWIQDPNTSTTLYAAGTNVVILVNYQLIFNICESTCFT
jgi:hypothetical protein